jgi:hypothetical protein
VTRGEEFLGGVFEAGVERERRQERERMRAMGERAYLRAWERRAAELGIPVPAHGQIVAALPWRGPARMRRVIG